MHSVWRLDSVLNLALDMIRHIRIRQETGWLLALGFGMTITSIA